MKKGTFAWPKGQRIAVAVTVMLEQWSEGKPPPWRVQGTSLKPGTLETRSTPAHGEGRQFMRLRLAHYRNRFSMFRIYYALRAGLIKEHGIELEVIEVPDPPSRELEECLIRGEVDLANLYLPNFLERRLDGAPIIGLCTEWKSTGKGNGLFVRRGEAAASSRDRRPQDRNPPRPPRHPPISSQERVRRGHLWIAMERQPAGDVARGCSGAAMPTRSCCSISSSSTASRRATPHVSTPTAMPGRSSPALTR